MALITTRDTAFELKEGETLLEGLERTGHEVEYQCRSGYCGSCRVHILSGRVDYDHFPLAFIGPNEILPCCCRVSEAIEIDCHIRSPEPDLFDVDLFEDQTQND
ncbi:class I ribonucleotide reductase maintenance protein YfaE [Neisseria animaloris]|uniref:Iron-sulfur binding protein n=1 Tax=Neisseria animaloris TaxID=326522 RepID=A0A3S5BVM2_9NEIS|nr:class I ribonucleotide reductase maintenance protein YfaE [Neisseria animaloris]VEJ21231.1 iron-sulfur binding protein [Neisseria animaloris]